MTHIPIPPTHIGFAGISEVHPSGVQALQDIDPTIRQNEIFGIIGRNGTGKSTLLRLFNHLKNASSGEMLIHGEPTIRYSTHQLRGLYRRVTTILQHLNLMATKTVAQNTASPLKMADVLAGEHQRRVDEILEPIGLSTLCDSYPAHLSGGQKQRTGIAWALVTQLEILLCGEVTLALDPENTPSVLTLLKEINQRLDPTIVLIAHEMEVIRTLCDRVSVLEDGHIVEQGDVWRAFGNPQHLVTHVMLSLQHPDRPEAGSSLRNDERIMTLRFGSSSGCEPSLQYIVSLLGSDAQLLYSNCECIQGRTIGQLQARLSGPLAASALAQDGWVADSIPTHHHQTMGITAFQPSNGIILPILCQGQLVIDHNVSVLDRAKRASYPPS